MSTIDVKTRTKHPNDITVGTVPLGVAVTPDGKTRLRTNASSEHGVDDRREDQDQVHPGRHLGSVRVGHAVSAIMRSRTVVVLGSATASFGGVVPGRRVGGGDAQTRICRRHRRFGHQRRQWHGVDDRRVARCTSPTDDQRRLAARTAPGRYRSNLIRGSTGKGQIRNFYGSAARPSRPGNPLGLRHASLQVPDHRRWRSAAPTRGALMDDGWAEHPSRLIRGTWQ